MRRQLMAKAGGVPPCPGVCARDGATEAYRDVLTATGQGGTPQAFKPSTAVAFNPAGSG